MILDVLYAHYPELQPGASGWLLVPFWAAFSTWGGWRITLYPGAEVVDITQAYGYQGA